MSTRHSIRAAVTAAGLVLASAALSATGTIQITTSPAYIGPLSSGEIAGEIGVVPATFTGIVPAPMTGAAAVPGTLFQTFCVERFEHIAGAVLYNWTSGNASIGGGGGAIAGQDLLSPESAFLYTLFCRQLLTGYDYTLGPARVHSAGQLQLALWVLEDEYPELALNAIVDADAIAFIARARLATVVGGEWDLVWGQNSIGNVRVLVLSTVAGVPVQDLLILTNLPPDDPAEPGQGGGGHGPGFWHNKNGQCLIGADDLLMLRGLNLVNQDGTPFDPTTKGQVKDWIQQNGTNMAAKLSSHLASMALSVQNGFVDPTALLFCNVAVDPSGQISVTNLMSKANTELGLHPITIVASPARTYQEQLKDALEGGNDNTGWVNP